MQTLEPTHPKLLDLTQRLGEIHDLHNAGSLLGWDQATYMPPGGAAARGRQLATLRQLAHAKFTDGAIAQLLDDLQNYADSLPYESNTASLIRLTRRQLDDATRIPADLIARLATHRAESYQAWARARETDDFALVQPFLEKMLALSRERASYFPEAAHPADPLIAKADYGLTVAALRPLFAALRAELVPLVEAITAQPPAPADCLHQHFPEAQQLAFSQTMLRQLGYDFERGRQDKTLHPFMTNFSINDVRITTRVNEQDFSECLFSTIHEMGHAFYELGNDPAFERTPLAGGISSGVHESQSRLWENLVGRSRPFWEYAYPQAQAAFPDQLGNVPLETFYRAINKVARSLIRTDADEVTYNLHVMIRFDLEAALLDGSLAVADLPAAWNERYRSDLGLVPDCDRVGVLQDVHWFSGQIGGMFQGYTLGNLMSAQFFEAAVAAQPDIPAAIAQGNFAPLRDWLTTHIYRQGRKFTATELLERVTGQPLQTAPLVRYLRHKYGELYDL